MNRLMLPEPDIKICDDGFRSQETGKLHGQLGRADKALSGLVDHTSDPMVIALDGGRGPGQSFFLKCWVGKHLKRETATQTVVLTPSNTTLLMSRLFH